MFTKAYWLDKDIQKVIGNILRYGVLCSAICVIAGGILYLWSHAPLTPQYKHFEGAKPELRSLSGILNGVMQLQGDAIIQLGVALLIATPVTRVFFSIFAFALEKDYLYVFITILVLGIILFSMLSKIAG
jgi:uncharacterized membrane protein